MGKWIFEKSTGTIIGYSGTVDNGILVVPSKIGDVRVKSIRDNACCRLQIEELYVSEGIEHIGSYSFYACGLVKIVLPRSLISLGKFTFADNKLVELQLPVNLEIIGIGCFANNSIAVIVFNTHLKIVGVGAFANNSIEELKTNNAIAGIGEVAFAGNRLPAYIDLSATLKFVGDMAFTEKEVSVQEEINRIFEHCI